MEPPHRRVTMTALARLAGVSQSTVSLALRNDPRISEKTKSRVLSLAQRLGYEPDPALSALIAYRARTRPIADYGKIAVLHDMEGGESRFPLALRQQIAGIREQAASLGFGTELFCVSAEGKASLGLSRILFHRGIRGLILTALRMPSLQMEWERFSAVVIGEYFSLPRLNHVNHHHSQVLSTAYEELRRLGYRKIGFCNSRISEERKHHLYLGAYLKCIHLDGIFPQNSMPLLYEEGSVWSPLPWLDHYGFDAVMSMVPDRFLQKLKGSEYKVPRRLGVAGFSIPQDDPASKIAGCVLDYRKMGAAAVDLLQSLLHHGQRGTPRENEQYDVLIRGHWRGGATVRLF